MRAGEQTERGHAVAEAGRMRRKSRKARTDIVIVHKSNKVQLCKTEKFKFCAMHLELCCDM